MLGLMTRWSGRSSMEQWFRERSAKRRSAASPRLGGTRPPAVSVRLVGQETDVSCARYLWMGIARSRWKACNQRVNRKLHANS
ncbi:hypothetical protein C5B91_17035 [Haloferax sp. Atlit-10N]|nr:hypothetical protein C5B86_17680 [Haloferax sp. Atlit-19N]RDZ40192.1 hypothetical protein C5B87_17095 [Haloferax sp. Atlit-16N]RDZ56879.1 hypothetical protein C5B91_17035 [Haloferax sp. Atlit-10N]REA02844.1 hypothetical protein DEQ92_13805 [Haloferax sp. Atlit-6N]